MRFFFGLSQKKGFSYSIWNDRQVAGRHCSIDADTSHNPAVEQIACGRTLLCANHDDPNSHIATTPSFSNSTYLFRSLCKHGYQPNRLNPTIQDPVGWSEIAVNQRCTPQGIPGRSPALQVIQLDEGEAVAVAVATSVSSLLLVATDQCDPLFQTDDYVEASWCSVQRIWLGSLSGLHKDELAMRVERVDRLQHIPFMLEVSLGDEHRIEFSSLGIWRIRLFLSW